MPGISTKFRHDMYMVMPPTESRPGSPSYKSLLTKRFCLPGGGVIYSV